MLTNTHAISLQARGYGFESRWLHSVMSRDIVAFGLLVEDHFGVRVSPIGDGGIVLAAVKADALAGGLRPALTVAAGAAGGC